MEEDNNPQPSSSQTLRSRRQGKRRSYTPRHSDLEVPMATLPDDVASEDSVPLVIKDFSTNVNETGTTKQEINMETIIEHNTAGPAAGIRNTAFSDVTTSDNENSSRLEKSLVHNIPQKPPKPDRTDSTLSELSLPSLKERRKNLDAGGKASVIMAYWMQVMKESEPYRRTLTRQDIQDYVKTVLQVLCLI